MKNFVFAFLLVCSAARATVVSERINAINRMIPLKKITIGPDDQYQGSVDPNGENLIFTHKTNLVSHLRVQNLKSGDVRDFLPLDADSQESAFGKGGLVAFTYFKFSVRGDICYAAISEKSSSPKITCLPRNAEESLETRSNPFWKSENEIGYVSENPKTQNRTIVSQNIKTGQSEIIVTGKIFSPSMILGGQVLTYVQMTDLKREIVVFDLKSKSKHVLHFELPGISGFPALGTGEGFLYFSHYPNDSNGDNILDGSDNGVIFRIAMAKVLKSKDGELIFPEQLTSLESSCSFPHPFREVVYATCAFEGSLDIYELPATGIIPTKWDKNILNNSIRTSRSYQERILNLNTVKFRDPSDRQITNERLLNNHILADEMAAAQNYMDQLLTNANRQDKDFLKLIKIYIEARQLKKSQPSVDVSREFRQQILSLDQKLAESKNFPNLNPILRGLLRVFISDVKAAKFFLAKVSPADKMKPLERYLYFMLAEQCFEPDPKDESRLLNAYHIMMAAPELDEAAHIYYAARLLDQIGRTHKDLDDRIKIINLNKKFLLNPVLTLLEAETCVLNLIKAPDKEKAEIYPELDKLMSQTRDDYFLRKALYIRATLNFTASAQFFYDELVATAWLKYTNQSDTEFIYAREVVENASLDEAYQSVANKNDTYASSYFFGSLQLTDDLESHYGYVAAMARKNLRPTIDQRYKNLVSTGFIDDNMKFVNAFLILIDHPLGGGSTKYLDQSIALLESMTQDRDSPVRYLFLGYCYLQKLLQTANGLDFSSELMQKSNRSLMLAYDLGRDNLRIQAASLINLGILQSRVQNQALASRFFQLRKNLGFVSAQEKSAFEYLYSRSLFLSHQPELAASELSEIDEKEMTPAVLERRAFYLLASGKYSESALAYQEFFSLKPQLDDVSFAKINLSDGFALLRNGQAQEAQNHLNLAIQALDRLSKIPRGADRTIEFDPERMKVFAYGFLGQTGSKESRLAAIQKRLELLRANSDLLDNQPSEILKAQLQIAKVSDQPKVSSQYIRLAVEQAQTVGHETQYLDHGVFVGANSALIHAFLHPEVYSNEDLSKIRKLAEDCIHAYENQKIPQPFLNYQSLKLRILTAAFDKMSSSEIDKILESALARNVKEMLPAQWIEIQKLRQAI